MRTTQLAKWMESKRHPPWFIVCALHYGRRKKKKRAFLIYKEREFIWNCSHETKCKVDIFLILWFYWCCCCWWCMLLVCMCYCRLKRYSSIVSAFCWYRCLFRLLLMLLHFLCWAPQIPILAIRFWCEKKHEPRGTQNQKQNQKRKRKSKGYDDDTQQHDILLLNTLTIYVVCINIYISISICIYTVLFWRV